MESIEQQGTFPCNICICKEFVSNPWKEEKVFIIIVFF